MGLGPLVCLHCYVFTRTGKDLDICPQCGEENYLDYLWMFTEEEQNCISNNSKFYRFVAGEDPV